MGGNCVCALPCFRWEAGERHLPHYILSNTSSLCLSHTHYTSLAPARSQPPGGEREASQRSWNSFWGSERKQLLICTSPTPSAIILSNNKVIPPQVLISGQSSEAGRSPEWQVQWRQLQQQERGACQKAAGQGAAVILPSGHVRIHTQLDQLPRG